LQYTVRALVDPQGSEVRLGVISRTFSSMVRTAYNRLLEGKRTNEIVRLLQARYGVENWRWCQWAIAQAQGVIRSQRGLLPLYAEMYDEKIARVRRRMERVADPLKKRGCGARIAKLERRKGEIEKHITAGTVPRAVFGSRKLLEGLSKGKGSREEWRHRRANQLFSVGQANCGGNANTRIIRHDGGYALEVQNWPGGDFTVGLVVPEYYRSLLDDALKSGVAYSVRVKRGERNYQVMISFEVVETPLQPWNRKRVVAIDVNPEGLAVTIVSPDGNLFASRWFREPALVHARAEKRAWLASNLVKRAFRWIKGYGCNVVVIEKLCFGMAQEGNHSANRVCSNFLRKTLIELIKLRALKHEWICADVNASYSSIAGGVKYGRQFSKFNGHQLAAFVLARRALGYGEKLNAEQLGQIPRRRRAYTVRVISSFHCHRHELLKPRVGTDGRMSGGDVKGAGVVGERVTPHTAVTSKPRLSLLLGGGCPGDEPGARGHRVNPPPSIGVKLGSINSVNKVNVF
jgi:predicted transposase